MYPMQSGKNQLATGGPISVLVSYDYGLCERVLEE